MEKSKKTIFLKMARAEKLEKSLFPLSYNKHLTPAVYGVCIGGYVSVKHCCSCTDELFLA